MLPCNTPADKDPTDALDFLMDIFQEFDAELQKLRAHIVNNERRIVALEAMLYGLLLVPGYQRHTSLLDNVTMAFGALNRSIVMARAVLAAQELPDAQARAAGYLASLGALMAGASTPDEAYDRTGTASA